MSTEFEGVFLGVLGGMGPLASAVFMERLTALTVAERDQDHIPAILWSDPRIPDRTDAKLHGGADPLPWLIQGAMQLKKAGAQAIVIPCNSAHLWYDELVRAVDIEFLHIARSTIDDLKKRGITRGRIGLMGATGTLNLGLYQKELEQQGFDYIVPHPDELEYFCMRPIRLVKANRVEEAYLIALECIALLKQRGADAIVLGCTEYPIAVPHDRRESLGIALIDSIDGLARAAIEWHAAASKR
jgi:aspartate racemase